MLSLPIPDKRSSIPYSDIRWHEHDLGSLVSQLTKFKIPASHRAHLDPDLNPESLPRLPGWRPLLGQTGAAQGHLGRRGVQDGDVFLFFGLFRRVVGTQDGLAWDKNSPPRHVIWGWLQIDHILKIDTCDRTKIGWALYHPHFHRDIEKNNTLYIAQQRLDLPGMDKVTLAGAGVFHHFSHRLQLSVSYAESPLIWALPDWCFPRGGKFPLTYHRDLSRWQQSAHGTKLQTVARGQEFVLDCDDYPESIAWLGRLLGVGIRQAATLTI